MRKLSSNVKINTSDSFDYITHNKNEDAKWIDESSGADQNTESYKFDKGTIRTHYLYSQPSISQKLIDDLSFDVESWIIDSVANNFAKTENKAFMIGDGQNQPSGLTNNIRFTTTIHVKDDSGRYIWYPGVVYPDMLLGAPLYTSSDLDPKINNNFAVAYGNFKKAYQIVDRSGIEVIRDPYTQKPFVKLYTNKRVGGSVINNTAFALLSLQKI